LSCPDYNGLITRHLPVFDALFESAATGEA
jgi:hypothetical protein